MTSGSYFLIRPAPAGHLLFTFYYRKKALYEEIYSDLINQGEIPLAEFVKEYVLDVEEELVYAKTERLAKSSMDFDIVSILEEQEQYERSFKKKIRKW